MLSFPWNLCSISAQGWSRPCWTPSVLLDEAAVSLYLQWEVGDDAGDSEAHEKQVGEDEGSGGVDNLLDLFVRTPWLTGLPDQS